MQVYGIIGGIGSGKSTAAQLFEACGAVVLNADRIGHEVLHLPEVKTLARHRWGDSIFDEQGEIVRSRLAAIVFVDSVLAKSDLLYLQELTHPQIAKKISQNIEVQRDLGTKVVILDAPLLLEANWDHLVSGIIFVDSPESQRWERAKNRSWTREEFEKRERSQLPLEEKRARCEYVLTNAGSVDELRSQVKNLWNTTLVNR